MEIAQAGHCPGGGALPVTLITYDTGQSVRGRNTGLSVIKLRDKAGTGLEPAKT